MTFGLASPGPQAFLINLERSVRDLFSDGPSWKAVSIWQPYASLMARGVKTVITYHWPTDYRGGVAIHAAKTLDLASAPDELCYVALGPTWRESLPASAVVAVGQLVDVRPAPEILDQLSPADRMAGVFAAGRHAWMFENLRALRRPIPIAGRQGLFSWTAPDDLAERLGPVLDHAAEVHRLGWSPRELERLS